MKAFKGYVTARSGLLLGGNKRHESYPFETQEDALAWAETVCEANLQAHRDVSLPKVKIVNHHNPIKRSEVTEQENQTMKTNKLDKQPTYLISNNIANTVFPDGRHVHVDLNEVWRETFAHWDCLVDTDTASAIATCTERVLRARITV